MPNPTARAVDTMLGRRLRARRVELGVGAAAVAAVLGVAEDMLHSWEDGEIRPPYEQLLELGELLNYPMVNLFRGADYSESG